uniref:Uncharacterized protein n=1 Tax=Romanomermis culicivorax TaxID=13658 RepID=A0A915JJ01_ROMCU
MKPAARATYLNWYNGKLEAFGQANNMDKTIIHNAPKEYFEHIDGCTQALANYLNLPLTALSLQTSVESAYGKAKALLYFVGQHRPTPADYRPTTAGVGGQSVRVGRHRPTVG